MASPGESKKARLSALLSEWQPQLIDGEIFEKLKRELAPVSDSYLRQLVKASGVALSPLVEGVAQDSLQSLRRTLVALQHEYSQTDRDGARKCRQFVIDAKQRARWAARKATHQDKRESKEEMILWMVTWLENPGLFADWVSLRERATEVRSSEP